MISEGSCDTEDWSNDAENSGLHHRNKLHFKIWWNRKQILLIVIIFHNIFFFYHGFGEHRRLFFFKTLKHLTNPKLLESSVCLKVYKLKFYNINSHYNTHHISVHPRDKYRPIMIHINQSGTPHTHARTHARAHTHWYTTHARTHAHTHARTHTHTHTHTHTCLALCWSFIFPLQQWIHKGFLSLLTWDGRCTLSALRRHYGKKT